MQSPGLLRGLLLLLLLALVLLTFNQTRLIARDLATRRLAASRLLADRVQADSAARLQAALRKIAADPAVRQALSAGELGQVAAAARERDLDPRATVQVVSVGQALTLRVVTSGPFNPGALWEAMREALEEGTGEEASGVEWDEQRGDLAVVAAGRQPAAEGTRAAVAVAQPLDEGFVEAVKEATGLEVSLYSPGGVRLATTLADEEPAGQGEPPGTAAWRRWERRQRPFVTASVTGATAVDPVRNRHGTVIGVREMTTPLAYGDALRRLPSSRRFLFELLFLGLAAMMATLIARSGSP